MMSSRRLLRYDMDAAAVAMVAMMLAIFVAEGADGQGPLDTMAIYNDFVGGDLAVECDHQVLEEVHPEHAHKFFFDPNAQSQLLCTFITMGQISPKRSGRFVMWVKNASFKPCEHICIWSVNQNGLATIDAQGHPVHIYSWA